MTTNSRIQVAVCGACLAAMVCAANRAAATIAITPQSGNNDTWIGQKAAYADTNWVGDAISTRSTASDVRYGIVQFNLSSVTQPITNAFIEMASISTTAVTLAPAYWVDGNTYSGDLSTITWNNASTVLTIPTTTNQFAVLGSQVFASGSPAGDVYGATTTINSSNAPGDLTVLNSIRQEANPILTMIFKATSGTRDWAGTEADMLPFTLLLNLTPGDFTGDGLATLQDYTILKNHWGQSVAPYANGDTNGDGRVDLSDFVTFKSVYTGGGPGAGDALAVPTPEPSTMALLAMAPLACFLLRVRKKSS